MTPNRPSQAAPDTAPAAPWRPRLAGGASLDKRCSLSRSAAGEGKSPDGYPGGGGGGLMPGGLVPCAVGVPPGEQVERVVDWEGQN